IGSVDLEMANAPALLPTAAPIPPVMMMPPGLMGGMPGGPGMAPPPGMPMPGKATIVSPKPVVPQEAK
ncbi:MAG TPA: hypothetical protein VNC50_06955, partial [Planctomycetia bacterium]|nr:hypothetical protein [Planctomycetia bacterium]